MGVIQIPTPLRKYTGNQNMCRYEGETVAKVIEGLVYEYPDMEPQLFAKEGKLHVYLHIFIGGQDIMMMQGLDTPVYSETVIKLIPAIAGG